jgi:hypothetical protein
LEETKILEELKEGFTIRAIILAIILGVLGLIGNSLTWWVLGMTTEPLYAGRLGIGIYPPYGLVFILVLLSAILKNKGLTIQEIVVITTTTFIMADSPFLIGAYLQFMFAGTYLMKTDPQFLALSKFYPPLWTPGLENYDLVAPALVGGAAVPWGGLLPYLGFWMLIALLWLFMVVFQAAVIRIQLVKKERLPFPMMIPVKEMLIQQQKGTFMEYVKKPPFSIGFIVGGILAGLDTLNYLFHFLPAYYTAGRFTITGIRDFLSAISQGTINNYGQFMPLEIAIAFLAPFDALATMFILLFFFEMVFPLILLNTGAITPGTWPGGAGPFPWVDFMWIWIPLAIGFWVIVFGFKTYAESIKKKEDSFVWAGFAGTWLIWLILWIVFGASVFPFLAGVIIWFLYTTGMTANVAAAPGFAGWWDQSASRIVTWGASTMVGVLPAGGEAANTQTAWATLAGVAMTSSQHAWTFQGTHAVWAYTANYSLTEPCRVKETSILKALALGVLLTVLIGFPFGVYSIYTNGLPKVHPPFVQTDASISAAHIPWVVSAAAPPASYNWWMAPLAIVVMGIVFFLRSHFAWFFIVPYAFIGYPGGAFLNITTAFIFKILLLKVFGAKAYEETGVPVATGLATGMAFVTMVVFGVNAFTGSISLGFHAW